MDNRMLTGRGVGPVPFKKVPGPASKTLYRSAPVKGDTFGWMSTQPSTSYSAAVAGSRTTPGPACSKLSNNAFRPNSINPPTPTLHSLKQEPPQQKHNSDRITTSCLFCTDPVIISSLRSAIKTDQGETGTLHQMIRNLCFHMQMDSKQLPNPNEFSQIKFPFCNSCEELLETLRDCQKIIEEAQATITKTVSEIERVVADAEILNSSSNEATTSSAATIEQQKFSMLRSMILEVYRNKLVIRKTLRKTLKFRNQVGLERPRFSHMSIMRDENLRSKFSSSTIESLKLKSQNSIPENTRYEEEEDEVENMTLDVNPMDVDAPSEDSEQSEEEVVIQEWNVPDIPEYDHEQDLQRKQNDRNPNSQEDSPDRYPNARYDENRCTLVISNVRGFNKSHALKQETSTSTEQEDEPDEHNNSYSNEVPITPTGTGTQKRKLLFEGIEIYRGTCPVKGEDYLQCSRCPHRIPITKYYEKRIVSAYVKMKIHIKNMHQKKRQQASTKKVKSKPKLLPKTVPKLKSVPCRVCKKQFPDAKTLEAHMNIHQLPTHICDICGRPVKGWYNNLLSHKFSHKNDDERKAAIAAGERGASNTLLSKKQTIPLFKNKYVPKPKKCIAKPKRYITKPKKYLVSEEPKTNVSTVNELSCGICSRKFIRRCYLALHMKTHNPARVPYSRKKGKAFGREAVHKEIRNNNGGAIMETNVVASGSPFDNELMDFVMPQGEVVGLEESIVEDNDSNDDGGPQWWTDEEDRD